jgi:leucyl aminopeptidase
VPDKVFRVHLVAHGALPAGAPLVTGGGLDARVQELSEAATGLVLTVAADWSRPVVELRWLVDQVVRRVRRLYDMRGARAQLEGEVTAVVRTAIALDLRRAFPTQRESLALDGADERFAASEDLYRRWVNEDPAVRTSIAICEDVRQLAALDHGGTLEIDILEPDRLRELGLNLLLAVGAASEQSPPRLALAKWTPPNLQQSQRPVMLLGKGITFDTGGINVKPYESFVSHMRNDMAGAALAFAAFRHLVQSGYPRPLVLAIPTCENAIGENAMRPGTVVRSHRGLRVKIDHTDAEGRLVLADGLSYAEERFAPELTFCFATLTTAALQAYGPYATPVHFASPEVERALRDASEVTGEDLHFFPSRPWHFEANRDDEADLKNTARLPGYMPHAAGSRNAAHFFLHFAKHPIVHADIFASTWNWAGDYPGTGFGATGAPLRTFIAALEALG